MQRRKRYIFISYAVERGGERLHEHAPEFQRSGGQKERVVGVGGRR